MTIKREFLPPAFAHLQRSRRPRPRRRRRPRLGGGGGGRGSSTERRGFGTSTPAAAAVAVATVSDRRFGRGKGGASPKILRPGGAGPGSWSRGSSRGAVGDPESPEVDHHSAGVVQGTLPQRRGGEQLGAPLAMCGWRRPNKQRRGFSDQYKPSKH